MPHLALLGGAFLLHPLNCALMSINFSELDDQALLTYAMLQAGTFNQTDDPEDWDRLEKALKELSHREELACRTGKLLFSSATE